MAKFSAEKTYYSIGIVILVIILLVATGGFFAPQVSEVAKSLNFFNPRGSPGSKTNLQTEQEFTISGKVVEVDVKNGLVTIQDLGTGQLYQVKITDTTKVIAGVTGRAFDFGSFRIGQQIQVTTKKPTGSVSSGTSGGPSSSGGGSGSSGGAGSNPPPTPIEEIEEISVFFPFPAISAQVVSVDTAAKTLEVATLGTQSKAFQIKTTDETEFNKIDPSQQPVPGEFVFNLEDLRVGSEIDVFTEEDPNETSVLTALLIVLIKF